MIDDRLPPLELRRAVDKAIEEFGQRGLREASERLTAAYRGLLPGKHRSFSAWTDVDRLAYVVARMPATYFAALAVLRELRIRCPQMNIERMLDLGSGPATSLWAAWSEIDDLTHATLVDPDPDMIVLAKRLIAGSTLTQRVETIWDTSIGHFTTKTAYDLVVGGYVLGEMEAGERQRVVADAWTAARGAVVFIEPGSPDGFRRIMETRDQLIGYGASIVAPCPHAGLCPMPADDWCHFAVRLNRTSLQRRLKGGVLAYEDEKYTYVVATRGAGSPSAGRVIRRPDLAPGRVTVKLCHPEGLREETVTRRNREAYRASRKLQWGDSYPHSSRS